MTKKTIAQILEHEMSLNFSQTQLPLPNLHSLTILDLIMLFIIIVVWQVYTAISLKRHPIEKLREDPKRLSSYNYTMLQLWSMALGILVIWAWVGRPFFLLGFGHSLDAPTLVAWGVAALGILFSAFQLYQVKTSEAAREKIRQQLEEVGEYTKLLMPTTDKEHRRSMWVGITAGITEEIIFRGYLIWAFSLFMNPWLAGLLSITLFVVLHRYQEKAGLIQVTGFAVVTTILYLICGSLWPVIVLHVGVDMLNISLARQVYKNPTP